MNAHPRLLLTLTVVGLLFQSPGRFVRAGQQEQEEAVRAKALQSFVEFQKPFLTMLARRDYAHAAKEAEEAATNPAWEPLKERIMELGAVAQRLNKFLSSLSATLAQLKGRSVTVQGETAVLADVVADKLELERRLAGGSVAVTVPIAKLTPDEIAVLVLLAKPNDKEALLDLAWFCFAEGKGKQADTYLGDAEKAGADVADARILMAALTTDPLENRANELIARAGAQRSHKRWDEMRATLAVLRANYGQTKTVVAARQQLARMESEPIYAGWADVFAPGALVKTFSGHRGAVRCAVFSPDWRHILSASDDKTLKLWDVVTGQEVQTLVGHAGWVLCAAFSPDGKFILSGGTDRKLRLWDVATGAELTTSFAAQGQMLSVRGVAFSPDGKRAASTSGDIVGIAQTAHPEGHGVRLWDISTGKEIRAFENHTNIVNTVAFSPDGRYIASGGDDKAVFIVEVSTGKVLYAIRDLDHGVRCLAFSPDGRFLVVGGLEYKVRLLDVKHGRDVKNLASHGDEVTSVAFSPDGRWILTGSRDRTLKLWNIATGKEVGSLTGHTRAVTSVAFSPDGRFALSASEDQTVRLWRLWDSSPSTQPLPAPVQPKGE